MSASEVLGEATRCLWTGGLVANRVELLRQLDLPEHAADADLLLQLYGRYGAGCAAKIHGDFAWLLWDGAERNLIACRDRMGTQPLYYSLQGGSLRVAVDLASWIAAQPHRRLRLQSAAAHLHGALRIESSCFDEGVSLVPPANVLTARPDRVSFREYWRLAATPTLHLADDREYVDAFSEIFFPLVGQYIPSHPFGLTLSGGLDSSSLAVAVNRQRPGAPVTALRWISPDFPEADEDELSAATCDRLGWSEKAVRADTRLPLSDPESLVANPARPQATYYPEVWRATMRCCREAGLRTLWTGLPGDLLFAAGFYAYLDLLLTLRWRQLWVELSEHRRWCRHSFPGMMRRMLLQPLRQAYGRPRPPYTPDWLTAKARRLLDRSREGGRWGVLPGRRFFLRRMSNELVPVLAEAMTLDARRFGLTMQHPLLDHRLFEFAAGLPLDQVWRAGITKVLLRNVLRGSLSAAVTDRRRKIAPTTIFRDGFRKSAGGPARALSRDMHLAQVGLVDESRMREAVSDALAGRRLPDELWPTLTLEAWLRRYF